MDWKRRFEEDVFEASRSLFFEIAYKIAFQTGPLTLGYGRCVVSIEMEKIFGLEFVTNRIDRKFRFSFCSEKSDNSTDLARVKEAFESVRNALLFLLSGIGDDRRSNFINAYVSFYDDEQPSETAEYAYDLQSQDALAIRWRELLWIS